MARLYKKNSIAYERRCPIFFVTKVELLSICMKDSSKHPRCLKQISSVQKRGGQESHWQQLFATNYEDTDEEDAPVYCSHVGRWATEGMAWECHQHPNQTLLTAVLVILREATSPLENSPTVSKQQRCTSDSRETACWESDADVSQSSTIHSEEGTINPLLHTWAHRCL